MEAVDSAFEFFGGVVEDSGEGLPLGKGITAPPVAACCSRVLIDGGRQTADGGRNWAAVPPNIMPRINGMM
jgi:hypothetical protein